MTQKRHKLEMNLVGGPHRLTASRRRFLSAVAAFTIVPRYVLGQGQTPPSEKLNIAGIGIGGQGGEDLKQFPNENIVALCDVDWAHAAHTFDRYPRAVRYKDYREMFDKQRGIDAVVVGTPDHLHAPVSMMAINHGKHVYCEKPVTLDWYDGGMTPPRPEELENSRELNREDGILFVGDKGKMLVEGWGGNSPRLIPEQRMKDYRLPPKTLPRSIGHYQEWVQACKTGTPTRSNFEFAGPLTEAVLLGTVCVRVGGQKLDWDSAKLKVTNCPQANDLLHYEYRKGWSL